MNLAHSVEWKSDLSLSGIGCLLLSSLHILLRSRSGSPHFFCPSVLGHLILLSAGMELLGNVRRLPGLIPEVLPGVRCRTTCQSVLRLLLPLEPSPSHVHLCVGFYRDRFGTLTSWVLVLEREKEKEKGEGGGEEDSETG